MKRLDLIRQAGEQGAVLAEAGEAGRIEPDAVLRQPEQLQRVRVRRGRQLREAAERIVDGSLRASATCSGGAPRSAYSTGGTRNTPRTSSSLPGRSVPYARLPTIPRKTTEGLPTASRLSKE